MKKKLLLVKAAKLLPLLVRNSWVELVEMLHCSLCLQRVRKLPKKKIPAKEEKKKAGKAIASEKFGSMAWNLFFGNKEGYVEGLESLLG